MVLLLTLKFHSVETKTLQLAWDGAALLLRKTPCAALFAPPSIGSGLEGEGHHKVKGMDLCIKEQEFGSYLSAAGEKLWEAWDSKQSGDEQGVPQ